MYAWIAQNLPRDANILWQDDTALYLATGRHSVSYVVPPREFEATGGDAERLCGSAESIAMRASSTWATCWWRKSGCGEMTKCCG